MEHTEREALVDEYCSGRCYTMALALGERLGLAVGALLVDVPTSWGPRVHVVHAYARLQDGSFLDASGIRDEAYFRTFYLESTRRKFSDPRFATFDTPDALEEFLFECAGEWGAEWRRDNAKDKGDALAAIEALGLADLCPSNAMAFA
jgi:hypothetical protein